jgi:hypothetical protein
VSSEELRSQLASDGADLGKQLQHLASRLGKEQADMSARLQVALPIASRPARFQKGNISLNTKVQAIIFSNYWPIELSAKCCLST